MRCDEVRPLLHPFLDEELDAPRSLEVQRHLQACPACARQHEAQRALRRALRDESLYHAMPAGFEARARAALRGAAGAAQHRAPVAKRAALRALWTWSPAWAAAAILAVAVGALWRLAPPAGSSAEERLEGEVIASHARSLMADHLTDVPSTDQHTVKPWFNGRIDFSPPVQDFAAQGFPLVGGRLDYLAGRPVAAIVYGRRRHVINLLVWPAAGETGRAPAAGEPDGAPATATRQGYHLMHWSRGGMTFWAVSDLNEDELKEFVGLVRR